LLFYQEIIVVDDCDSFEEDDIQIETWCGYVNSLLTNALVDSQLVLDEAQAGKLISLVEHMFKEYDNINVIEMADVFLLLHASASEKTSVIQLILYTIQNIKNIDDKGNKSKTQKLYCFFVVLINSLHSKNNLLEILYLTSLDYVSKSECYNLLYYLNSKVMSCSRERMFSFYGGVPPINEIEGFKETADSLLRGVNADQLFYQPKMSFIDRINAIKSVHQVTVRSQNLNREKNLIISKIISKCEHIQEDYNFLEKRIHYDNPISSNEGQRLVSISQPQFTQQKKPMDLTCVSSLIHRSFQVGPLFKLFYCREYRDICRLIFRYLDHQHLSKILSLNHLTRQVILGLLSDTPNHKNKKEHLLTNLPCLFFKKASFDCDSCDGPLWKELRGCK
jgi:hypothetical protein